MKLNQIAKTLITFGAQAAGRKGFAMAIRLGAVDTAL